MASSKHITMKLDKVYMSNSWLSFYIFYLLHGFLGYWMILKHLFQSHKSIDKAIHCICIDESLLRYHAAISDWSVIVSHSIFDHNNTNVHNETKHCVCTAEPLPRLSTGFGSQYLIQHCLLRAHARICSHSFLCRYERWLRCTLSAELFTPINNAE